ncbi:MAG: Rieske (2Fe-2S) protein, partial [Pseudomonadota bacterium]
MTQTRPATAAGNPSMQALQDDPFVRGVWYVAMAASDLVPGTMKGRTLLGEPILFARRTDGSVFALRDLCPHRGIPLRFGRFDGDTVHCGYHGWQFDGRGQCVAIPSLTEGQDADIGRIRTNAYRCAEQQGLIWIFLPDLAVQA